MIKIIKNRRKDSYEILIDDADSIFFDSYSWAVSTHGYVLAKHPKTNNQLHRLLLGVTDYTSVVDHINGNKLDNRRANLRIVSNKENTRNRHNKLSTKTSKYFGVYFQKDAFRRKPWGSRIYYNGKPIHLGYFATEIEAALSYNKFAKELGYLTRNII